MADKYINYNGMRFCPECDNIMKPTDEHEGNTIYFNCRSHGSVKIQLDRENKEDYLMKKSQWQQSSGADIYDKNMVLDPAIKKLDKKCPKCGFPQAVFYLGTDTDQRKIISYYICARLEDEFTPACYNKFTDEDILKAEKEQNKVLYDFDDDDKMFE